MADESIFGSPPEPVFNLKGCCLSSELLEDLLYVQAAQNEKTAKLSTSTDGIFKQGTIAGTFLNKKSLALTLPTPTSAR